MIPRGILTKFEELRTPVLKTLSVDGLPSRIQANVARGLSTYWQPGSCYNAIPSMDESFRARQAQIPDRFPLIGMALFIAVLRTFAPDGLQPRPPPTPSVAYFLYSRRRHSFCSSASLRIDSVRATWCLGYSGNQDLATFFHTYHIWLSSS